MAPDREAPVETEEEQEALRRGCARRLAQAFVIERQQEISKAGWDTGVQLRSRIDKFTADPTAPRLRTRVPTAVRKDYISTRTKR